MEQVVGILLSLPAEMEMLQHGHHYAAKKHKAHDQIKLETSVTCKHPVGNIHCYQGQLLPFYWPLIFRVALRRCLCDTSSLRVHRVLLLEESPSLHLVETLCEALMRSTED